MQGSPRRLRRLAAKPFILGSVPSAGAWPQGALFGRERASLVRRGRAVRRMTLIVLWTLLAILVQSLCMLLPGRPKIVFARVYWSTFAWLLGMHIRVIGQSASGSGASGRRPVVYVSNHSSWVDVPVLGGRIEACFVSKDDVARWPVVSTVAKLGRSVFVSRQRNSTVRELDAMKRRLAAGDDLMLFPEGTTSDGSRVLPFRSSFFAIAEGEPSPLIQPVSIVYDRLGGLPAGRACRPLFAWYGDMDIATHFWRLAQYRGLRATVLLHAPIDPARYPNRKALSHAVWNAVADGAATLRQNRPARPLPPESATGSVEDARTAYA